MMTTFQLIRPTVQITGSANVMVISIDLLERVVIGYQHKSHRVVCVYDTMA